NLLPGTGAKLPQVEKLKYTSSAFMMYLGMKRSVPELLHHNVVFGGDYRASFRDLFERKVVPQDPSFYLNVPSRTDPTLSPAGRDGIYVLVPVPDRSAGIDWRVEAPRLRSQIFRRIEELGIKDFEDNIAAERTFTPDDYQSVLNLERGSAFGLSHHFFQVGP